eukprot:TRINITY_DN4767_c0_g5_i1.p1 TRINITY_DN4767_c0_g5~~TRINITY_DN4767_c0_g5_i1.p1  ORF type:complete len:717 (+),score=99.52 TRINITY_DN4767_c0_g5_i1:53-2152(+)
MASKDPRFRSWPITEARALEPTLQEMGLRVPAADIDGTGGSGGKCLSDALISVGPAGRGGTGSFISKDGLIVTNHHVALDAVRQASTVEHDYVKDGFVAKTRSQEVQGPDYEVWITRSCEDVSEAVLEVVRSEADPLQRSNKIRDCKINIAKSKEAALPSKGYRCEVKEMFADKTYVLFSYERLRDVRIVYVPPMCLGNFGGDTDNFEWPRHSADFTLLRAYVGPDGTPAEPSPENIPYCPSKYLQVCPAGIQEGDFVFLLGFPGHTMRYAPTSRLSYSDEVAVPALVKDFGRKLQLIKKHSADSRAVVLKTLATKKSLSNELKRSSGKLVVMRKLGLLAERKKEEEALTAATSEAGPVLERLADVYAALKDIEPRSQALEAMRGIFGGSALLFAGHTLHEAKVEAAKPEESREESFRQRNHQFLVKRLLKRLGDAHIPLEKDLIADALALLKASGLPAAAAAEGIIEGASLEASKLASLSAADVEAVLNGTAASEVFDDPFVRVAECLYSDYISIRDTEKGLLSQRDQLLAQLLELQKAHSSKDEVFYPDANSTLRLSAGHVEGYQAADAVFHKPLTKLSGLFDKHVEANLSGQVDLIEEFTVPSHLTEILTADPSAAETPVNCLYSTDTVGGNSGSPVLNAKGEFVAINFDRQRLGLMNEFKWSSLYSRSIGVDVRYMLWLIGTYDSAEHIVQEMTG